MSIFDDDFDSRLGRTLMQYYSDRPADIAEGKRIINENIAAGDASSASSPLDLVNNLLLGCSDQHYLAVRALALRVRRHPTAIGDLNKGERLTMALLFERSDWLLGETYASAAERVGPERVSAVVMVEDDLRLLSPAIYTNTSPGRYLNS